MKDQSVDDFAEKKKCKNVGLLVGRKEDMPWATSSFSLSTWEAGEVILCINKRLTEFLPPYLLRLVVKRVKEVLRTGLDP